ncbi:MAG: D-aminoacyl-tRNA deacylase [Chitinophagaceae bacterium]
MRVVIQRVTEASVKVDEKIVGEIGLGLLILLGIEEADDETDIQWLCQKIAGIRIFNDENGLMNKSLADVGGRILVISQFTLFANTKKGNRPSFIRAAKPDFAIPMYEKFVATLASITQQNIETGIFGADMKVKLLNDGPVTVCIDSKQKE